MVDRGFQEVYQLDGGIVRYGETYRDAGLWEGSLYVFDKRMHLEFSDDAVTIGKCVRCQAPTNTFENCSNQSCRNLTLYCAACAADPSTLRCPQGCESDEAEAEDEADDEDADEPADEDSAEDEEKPKPAASGEAHQPRTDAEIGEGSSLFDL